MSEPGWAFHDEGVSVRAPSINVQKGKQSGINVGNRPKVKSKEPWMCHPGKSIEIPLQNKVALLDVIGYDVSG
jgi:hypothetical protein